jgi:GntR family transcriptional repressor for pyruvate dehydrogenase complex
MMELTPIKSTRLVDAVVEKLEAPILEGLVREGDKLPSEEQLAARLGVGRRAIREALKVLETKGLVETQMGIGTVVKRNDLTNFLDTLARNVGSYLRIHRAEARHVMELRQLLEGAALERLATVADEDRLQHLAKAVVEQRQAFEAKNYHEYQVCHFRFHQDIVDAVNNPVISMIYEQVMALMREPMERSGSRPEVTAQSIDEHEQLVEALKRGSTADVRNLLHIHLANFYSHMQEEGEANFAAGT